MAGKTNGVAIYTQDHSIILQMRSIDNISELITNSAISFIIKIIGI